MYENILAAVGNNYVTMYQLMTSLYNMLHISYV